MPADAMPALIARKCGHERPLSLKIQAAGELTDFSGAYPVIYASAGKIRLPSVSPVRNRLGETISAG